MRVIDLVGHKTGRLTVQARVENDPQGQAKWLCICECGNQVELVGASLRSGRARSCGCLKNEELVIRSTKHGHATNGISPTYHSWASMLARCLNSSNRSYPRYGGRGIKVCDRWLTFENFLADMGEKPAGRRKSIERIGNSGNYEPSNCRWATDTEQARNKRSNRWVTFNDKTMTKAEWCEVLGISRIALQKRLAAGWGQEIATTNPAKPTRTRLLTKGGETHHIAEWARRTGIPASRIYQRLHRGFTDEEALRDL